MHEIIPSTNPSQKKVVQKLKYTFSGHESFQCRHLWLKKGYDFVASDLKFSDPSAVVYLGVGKNMVSSIRFWMKAFDMIDENDMPTTLAHNIFSDGGWDPYLEDEGTLWLLHYLLVKNNFSSIYSLIFNELRKEKISFSKQHFQIFIEQKLQSIGGQSISKNSLTDDFNVFVKMYSRSAEQMKDKEDALAGLFADLDLISILDDKGEDRYTIENDDRLLLPMDIFHYVLLDFVERRESISFNAIETDFNSPGNIFAIGRNGLYNKIQELCEKNSNIVFNDHAGIKELQFKNKNKMIDILEDYYAK